MSFPGGGIKNIFAGVFLKGAAVSKHKIIGLALSCMEKVSEHIPVAFSSWILSRGIRAGYCVQLAAQQELNPGIVWSSWRPQKRFKPVTGEDKLRWITSSALTATGSLTHCISWLIPNAGRLPAHKPTLHRHSYRCKPTQKQDSKPSLFLQESKLWSFLMIRSLWSNRRTVSLEESRGC